MSEYIQSAFYAICKKVKEPETWFVCLMESVPFYGGPEEGGWWGRDSHLISYQEFPTEEIARSIAEKIKVLAEELSKQARDEFGSHCLLELDWLEARGLEPDFLPEVDGESEYYVTITQEIPQESRGDRHYS